MTPTSDRSFLDALRDGDDRAAQQLFEEFFLRLVGLARQKLQALPPRVADHSGVALSAMNSFFQGIRRGAYPKLTDRDDLWRLLVIITARKAAHAIRDERREKRGGGRVRGESVLRGAESDFVGTEQVVDRGATGELAVRLAEEFEARLAQLEDETLQKIAEMKLENHSNEEIAAEIDCVPRTVERKLKVIRKIWADAT